MILHEEVKDKHKKGGVERVSLGVYTPSSAEANIMEGKVKLFSG